MAATTGPDAQNVDSSRLNSREQRRALRNSSKRNDFSVAVRAHVRARDEERCVLCGRPGREVHHIVPRACGGLGTADNGVCLDASCHHQAHRSKKVEKQLLRFRERVLLPFYGLTETDQHVSTEQVETDYALQEQGLLCFRKLHT